jgi:transposase
LGRVWQYLLAFPDLLVRPSRIDRFGFIDHNRSFSYPTEKERAVGKEAKYVVRLAEDERQFLQALLSGKRVAADRALRARIFLMADLNGDACPDTEIADTLDVAVSTIHRLRQRLVEEGLEAALSRRPMSVRRATKLDGAQEAHLIAVACGPAPEGRARWTLKLLAAKLVELEVVDSIGTETVRQTLKKTR